MDATRSWGEQQPAFCQAGIAHVKHGVAVGPLNPFIEGRSSASANGGPVGDNAYRMAREYGFEDEESEVARRPRIARMPQMPKKSKVEAHMTLHAD